MGRSVERRHCLKPPCSLNLAAYNASRVFIQGVKSRNGETMFTLKGATSRFVHLEKFSLNFSSLSFAIRVNLLHP